MPRRNAPRTIGIEAVVAERCAYEREKRGWTYDGMASRMTAAGCPTQGSAIYKIEKGQPPRTITVNELAAMAKVFELEVAELFVHPAALRSAEVRDLFLDIAKIQSDMEAHSQAALADLRVKARRLYELEAHAEEIPTDAPMTDGLREFFRVSGSAHPDDDFRQSLARWGGVPDVQCGETP